MDSTEVDGCMNASGARDTRTQPRVSGVVYWRGSGILHEISRGSASLPERFPLVGQELASSSLCLGGTSPTLRLPSKEINSVLTERLSLHDNLSEPTLEA